MFRICSMIPRFGKSNVNLLKCHWIPSTTKLGLYEPKAAAAAASFSTNEKQSKMGNVIGSSDVTETTGMTHSFAMGGNTPVVGSAGSKVLAQSRKDDCTKLSSGKKLSQLQLDECDDQQGGNQSYNTKAAASSSSSSSKLSKQDEVASLPSKEQMEKVFFRVLAFVYDATYLTGNWTIRFIDQNVVQNESVQHYWKKLHKKMEESKKD